MRSSAAAIVVAVALGALLSGCAGASEGVRIGASPAPDRTPYAGPLTPSPSAGAQDPGAAGRVVRCSTTPSGSTEASPYTEGAVARTADHAIDVAFSEGLFLDLVTRSLDRERTDPDRVLFTTSYGGVARQAVVVRHGPAGPGTGADAVGLGWYVESWAHCDLADFPESVSSAHGLEIWSDRSGDRVPSTTVLSAAGPAHCGWQGMTFLELGGGANGKTHGRTYVRRPSSDLAAYFDDPFEAHTTLPADAVDTGWQREGRRLWLAADRRYAYVGDRSDVEAWPRESRPFGCA